MKKTNNTKAVLVAEAIQQKIILENLPKGTRIAPMSKLAKEYNVSEGTIQAAVNVLEEKGIVQKIRRSGIFVKTGEPVKNPEQDIAPQKSKADLISSQIIADIVNGKLEVGSLLPARKILLFQYRTSKRILKQVLEDLETRGMINHLGSHYRIGNTEAGRTKANTVYLVGTQTQFRIVVNHRVSSEFLRRFEQELNQFGITNVNVLDIEKEPKQLQRLVKDPNIRGFLHLGMRDRPRDLIKKDIIENELNCLKQTRSPSIIFNMADILFSFPDFQYVPAKNTFLYSIDNVNAGVEVGTYLGLKGHRNMAFLSFFGGGSWVKSRKDGIINGLKNTLGTQFQLFDFMHQFNEAEVTKNIAIRPPSPETKNIFNQSISNIFKGYRFTHNDASSEILHNMLIHMTDDACRRMMEPIFEQALKNREITAWACDHEGLAVPAKDFLDSRGIKVPEQISLIGIHNEQDAIFHKITCFDFQKSRAGYLAAHAIIGDIPVRKDRRGYLICPGRIVERGSVKQVGGK